MLFPHIYQETLERIKSGEYGEKWKELISSEPYLVIDAEQHLYRCGKCGCWEVEPGLTVYAPNESTLNQIRSDDQNGSGEKVRIPVYTWEHDFSLKYHRIKTYIHKCPRCGMKMKRARKSNDMMFLPCPKCGTENTGDIIRWD